MKTYHTARVRVFTTITEANVSGRLFQNGETLRIKGDHTRYKLGTGTDYTGQTPSTKSGKTFAQLPWIHIPGSLGNSFALNATGTLTAAQVATKYITSTSAAAVAATLPTAALLATQLGLTSVALAKGYQLDLTVDNLAGANAVTLALGTGIVAATAVITGGANLVVAAGSIGYFRIVFSSPTAALIFRLA